MVATTTPTTNPTPTTFFSYRYLTLLIVLLCLAGLSLFDGIRETKRFQFGGGSSSSTKNKRRKKQVSNHGRPPRRKRRPSSSITLSSSSSSSTRKNNDSPLSNNNNNNINISSILDIAIIGFPKSGTTSMQEWFKQSNEIYIDDDEKLFLSHGNINGLVEHFTTMNNKKNLHPNIQNAIKFPGDIDTPYGLQTLQEYFSTSTKLIIMLRHPLLQFESFYNYRLRNKWNRKHQYYVTDPSKLIGSCRIDQTRYSCADGWDTINECKKGDNVCTDRGQIHQAIARLGLTPMNTNDEMKLLGGNLQMTIHPWKRPVLFIEMNQLVDNGDSTTSNQFHQDVQTFLGVSHLPTRFPHSNDGRIDKHVKGEIDICSKRNLRVRKILQNYATKSSKWILKYLLESELVIVSNRTQFIELIKNWQVDPCHEREGNDNDDNASNSNDNNEEDELENFVTTIEDDYRNNRRSDVRSKIIQRLKERDSRNNVNFKKKNHGNGQREQYKLASSGSKVDKDTLKNKNLKEKIRKSPLLMEHIAKIRDKAEAPHLVGMDLRDILKFAIIGFPKCGTTTITKWLRRSPSVYMGDDHVKELNHLTTNRPLKLADMFLKKNTDPEHVMNGIKFPGDIDSFSGLKNMVTYYNNTKLIVMVRHPVLWFESFYNFRNFRMMIRTDRLIGSCRKDGLRYGCTMGKRDGQKCIASNVCTDRAQFHQSISRLGLTPMDTTDELKLLGEHDMTTYRWTHPVLFMEVNQLSPDDTNRRRDQLRNDLSSFLDLQDLPEQDLTIGNNHLEIFNETKRKIDPIDICSSEHRYAHAVLMQHAVTASRWIRNYLMQSELAIFSSPDYFAELVADWEIDPCIHRREEEKLLG